MNTYSRRLAKASRTSACKSVLAAALLSMAAAPIVHAGGQNQRQSRHNFTDYARVINVDPIYSRVAYEQPRRECWLEEQHHTTVYEGNAHIRRPQRQGHRSDRSHSVGDTLAGGVIGGVIGNQLGKRGNGNARIGATIAGAIIGSAIANERPRSQQKRHRRHDHQPSRPAHRPIQSRPVERCTTHMTTEYKREISGYQVTYRYHGQTFTTRTDRDPGDRIPVSISIRPLNH